jgi:4-hydroxy-4-methyl-2-oxoglutarate aldolase
MAHRDSDQGSQICDALRKHDSPTIANAVELLDTRDATDGFASLELRCQFPEHPPMVGYAVTCTVDSTTPGRRQQSKIRDLLDLIEASPKPAVVVGQCVGSNRLRTCMVGDNTVSLYERLGVVGVVTDGGNRDVARIRDVAPDFDIFSPGWVVSHGNPRIVDVGIQVTVCGLVISQGDLLHGDANGLLTIPSERAEMVLKHASEITRREQQLMDFLRRPQASAAELKARFLQ